MKKKIIIGAVIVIAISAFIAVSIMKNSGSSPTFGGGRVYEVKAEALGKGEISSFVSANGVVEEIEKAEVHFDTPLKVVKLFVENNQKVARSQQLMELDMDSLYSELEKLKINRTTQELSVNTVTLDAEIERAKNTVDSSERAYNDAKRAYESNLKLYEANAISKNELDMSEKAVLDAEAALNNARANYNSALSSKSLDTRTKSQNLKATDLSISDLENRIRKIKDSMLSPIDGVIAELTLKEGSYTSSMQPALSIVNLDKLQVKASVREYDIRNVKQGQDVKITGDAINPDVEITGKITAISPIAKINRTSGGEEVVIEVTVSIEKSDAGLKPGLNVTCDISTLSRKDVLVAPMEVFDEDKDGNKFAYVVDPDAGIMRKTPVKLGISSDMSVEVVEGLNEGDLLVINPQPIHKDGARVKITNQGTK